MSFDSENKFKLIHKISNLAKNKIHEDRNIIEDNLYKNFKNANPKRKKVNFTYEAYKEVMDESLGSNKDVEDDA